MRSTFREYIRYRRGKFESWRALRPERRLRTGIERNFVDAAERARADQEYRAGALTPAPPAAALAG